MTKLQELLERFGIKKWDVLLIGDGSGTTWDTPSGWCVILLDLITGRKELITGAKNRGSINRAELQPYLEALALHYYSINKGKLSRVFDVHIISDSEVTVKCGRGQYQRKANTDLWCMVDFWRTKGYNLHWHYVAAHVPGEPEAHVLTDKVAGESRKRMELAPASDSLESLF